MKIAHELPSSFVLKAIRSALVSEIAAQPAADVMTLKRDDVVMVTVSIGEVIDRLEVLEEGTAAAERLGRELEIVRADRERWRTAAETYHAAWAREVDRSAPRLQLVSGAQVVDLTEALRSGHRGTGQPFAPGRR